MSLNHSISSNPELSQSSSEHLLSLFEFSSSPLSSHKSIKNLSPVLIPERTFKLSQSNLDKILQKSLDQSIPKEGSSEEAFDMLIEKQIISPSPSICSDCRGPGMYYQKCSHYTCNICLYSKISCSACESPHSFYDFEYQPCLKCKKFDRRTQTCKHYCSDCIIHLLRVDQSFQCKICSFLYVADEFKDIQCKCDNCNRKGRMMEDFFIKICSGHLVCFDCVQSSCKHSTCLVCKKFLSVKDVYKIKKKFKTNCENCLKLKDLQEFPSKNCCKKKLCEDCLLKKGCC